MHDEFVPIKKVIEICLYTFELYCVRTLVGRIYRKRHVNGIYQPVWFLCGLSGSHPGQCFSIYRPFVHSSKMTRLTMKIHDAFLLHPVNYHCAACYDGWRQQPPPIIWSLSSHNIQSKPPLKSSLYTTFQPKIWIILLVASHTPYCHSLSPHNSFARTFPTITQHSSLRWRGRTKIVRQQLWRIEDASNTKGGCINYSATSRGQAPKWYLCKCNGFNQW